MLYHPGLGLAAAKGSCVLVFLESHVVPPQPAALVPPPVRGLFALHGDQLTSLPLMGKGLHLRLPGLQAASG